MKSFFGACVIISCSLVVASCGDDSSNGTVDKRVPFVAQNDKEFIDGMVPHHTMAMHMATMELERGSRADVKAFAQRVVDAQGAEIEQMKNARRELAGTDVVPDVDDPHMMADMDRMMGESGAALDDDFLMDMLPHHAGAIQMAHNALPNLQRSDMRALAQKIVDDQTAEIGELRALMDQ